MSGYHHEAVFMRRVRSSPALIFVFLTAPALFAAQAGAEAGGHAGRRLASRSGDWYETYDLGPVEGRPDLRRYELRIATRAAKTEVMAPGARGEWRLVLPGGGFVVWRPMLSGAETALSESATAAAEGRAAGPGWRRLANGLETTFHRAAGGEWGALRLPEGLTLESPVRDPAGGALLRIVDERGVPAAIVTLSGAGETKPEFRRGEWLLAPASPSADRAASANPPIVSVSVTLPGAAAGYQCIYTPDGVNGAAQQGTSGTVGEGYPFGWPQNTCDSYLRWDIAGLVPPLATVTQVALVSLNVTSYNGPTIPVSFTDVKTPLPYPNPCPDPTTCYNNNRPFNYYDDFRLPIGAYFFRMPVSGIGSIPGVPFGGAAAADFQAANRAGLGYFATGVSVDMPLAQGNFFTFSSTGSPLSVSYMLPVNPGLAINRIRVDNPAASGRVQIDLYNFGDDTDLSGWIVRAVNYNNVTQSFTLPAGSAVKRHKRLTILDTTGTNGADTVYTQSAAASPIFTLTNGALGSPSGHLMLIQPDGGGADYTCWGGGGAPPVTPAPPAATGWSGPCIAAGTGPGGDIHRVYDADTDQAADWAATPVSGTPDLQNGQFGGRRPSEIAITQVLPYPSQNWVEITNYGPDVDLTGWSLFFYDWSAGGNLLQYNFGGGTLAKGQAMWLAEGTSTFYAGSIYGAPDNLHRNLSIDLTWDVSATKGGEALLRDAGGTVRDYFAFGGTAQPHRPAYLPGYGPQPQLAFGTSTELDRESDLQFGAAAHWIGHNGWTVAWWGALNLNQQGASREQDEAGGGGQAFQNSLATGGGSGTVIAVTRQVAVEELAFEANPAAVGTATIVIKQQGSPNAILLSKTVTVAAGGLQVIHSGRISPVVRLDPGTYAVMLYFNGAWQDNERYNSQERLSFGAVQGTTFENGTPTAAFAVNYPNYAAHAWFSLVNPPLIAATPAPAQGEIGVAYSFTQSVSGGAGAPFTWAVASGSLPAGLTLNATTGVISGTPTASGTYYLTVQATDAAGLKAALAETLTINTAVAVSTAALPNASTTAAYSANLAASGGVGPFTYSFVSGVFPPGLSISAAGAITGTPTAAGNYVFTVQVRDFYNATAQKSLSIIVYSASLLGASGPVSMGGEIGLTFSQTFTASGGTSPYAWSVTSGTLPAGITQNAASGALSGTPTAFYNAYLTLRVTDAAGQTFDLTNRRITIQPRLKITDSQLTPYDSAVAYDHRLGYTGGSGPFTWTCAFPAGWTGLSCALNNNDGFWHITGALPASVADGVYSVNLGATDGLGVNDSKAVPITVYRTLQILTSALSGGTLGFDYGQERLSAVGGSGTPQWNVSGGSFPPGLALAAPTGLITGKPTQAGSFSFTVTYANAGGRVSKNFSIVIGDPVIPPYWVRRGLSGGSLVMYFSPSYTLDNYLLGRSGAQVFQSFDGGYFWQPVHFPDAPNVNGAFLSQDYTRTPAIAPGFDARPFSTPGYPAAGNHIYVVARSYSGLWYTDDLGATWTQINTGLASNRGAPYVFANSLYFDPNFAANRKLYVRSWNPAARHYAFFSGVIDLATKAITWTQISPPGLSIGLVSMSPTFAADHAFYYGQSSGSGTVIYRSTDSGVTWTVAGTVPQAVFGFIRFSPNFSTDGTLATAILDPFTYYYDGILVSHDSGATWTLRQAGRGMSDVLFPPNYNTSTNPKLFGIEILDQTTWSASQLLTSTDDGANFVSVGKAGMTAAQFGAAIAFSPNFAADSTLLATGNGSPGVFRSSDGGQTWSPSDGGLSNQPINDVAYAAGDPRTLAIATADAIYTTKNGGVSWRRASLPSTGAVSAVEISPDFKNDRKVFAWFCPVAGCQILRSTDGGVSFQALAATGTTLDRAENFKLSPDFARDRRIYFAGTDPATGYNTPLYRSSDEGLNFTAMGTPPIARFALSPDFAADHTLHASAGYDAVYAGPVALLSTDGGTSFTPQTTLPSANNYAPPAYSPDWTASGASGTSKRTLFWNCWKSVDGGQNFGAYPATGDGCSRYDYAGFLTPSPTFGADSTLYSYVQSTYSYSGGGGGLTGLFRSLDGGNTFARLSIPGDQYAFANVNNIAPSPAYNADRTVFVATGVGLYQSLDGGATWKQSTGTQAFAPDVSGVALDLNRAGVVYIGTQSGRVYYSQDDGNSADEVTANLLGGKIQAMVTTGSTTTRLVVGTPAGVYHRTDFTGNGYWTLAATGDFRAFTRDSASLYAARADGRSLRSDDGGVSWLLLAAALTDATAVSFNNQTTPTLTVSGGGAAAPAPRIAAGTTASLWSASALSGSFYSVDGGANWLGAPGGNDYRLPTGAGNYNAVQALGLNAQSGGREVLVGHGAQGVFLSRDGGDTWRNVSGPGSGLEATSKNASTFLATTTAYATTDVLVGVNGQLNGGVYLSGDGGEHWTQVNQGFDPNNLSISSLVRTSCTGCPVQYYSGTYGNGVYTRTITVNKPPFQDVAATWCAGGGCGCAGATATLSEAGGDSFKICGGNFQNGAVVEIDGVPAGGCTQSGGTLITCSGSPAHPAGPAARVVVRNPDTRARALPANAFTYGAAAPRASNARAAKNGADVWLSWSCTGCTTGAPARIYRAQNPRFSLYLEPYNGGANGTLTGGCTAASGNNSCYNNGGAVSSAQSYFWTVE